MGKQDDLLNYIQFNRNWKIFWRTVILLTRNFSTFPEEFKRNRLIISEQY